MCAHLVMNHLEKYPLPVLLSFPVHLKLRAMFQGVKLCLVIVIIEAL